MRDHGFDDPRQLQGLFTAATGPGRCASDGREVLAWDEVLDADAPDDECLAWRCADEGVEAAERGHDVVMAPMDYLYLDWVSSDAESEPPAQTAAPYVTTWEKVYGVPLRPRGARGRRIAARDPRGPGAAVDRVHRRVTHLDYMAFPRLSAFSEVVWGTAGDEAEFRRRLGTHLARLGAKGLKYRPLDA